MSSHAHSNHVHASDKDYYIIAVILAIVTFIEVIYPIITEGIYIFDLLFMPLLGILSLGKFVLVVGYFMHLKYDPKCLRYILYFSILIAVLIGISFLFLFRIVI